MEQSGIKKNTAKEPPVGASGLGCEDIWVGWADPKSRAGAWDG